MTEVRYRKTLKYVNDLANYTKKEPEVVFAFTLEELQALESWVPWNDGFHKEVLCTIDELKKRQSFEASQLKEVEA